MSFTYNLGTAGTALVTSKVRLELGDTTAGAALFSDEELGVWIGNRADNVLLAAADACEALSRRYAADYNFSTDGQSFSRGQLADSYAKRAIELRERAGSGIEASPVTKVDGYTQTVTAADVNRTGLGVDGWVDNDLFP